MLDKRGAVQYIYKEKLSIYDDDGNHKFEIINFIEKLHQFIKSSVQFYSELGYFGNLKLEVKIDNLLELSIPTTGMTTSGNSIINLSRNDLKWEKDYSFVSLQSGIKGIVAELISNITWSLGLDDFGTNKAASYLTANYYN